MSSSSCCRRWPARRAGCSPATCCWRGSGATRPTATSARSTSTSATCARRSSSTPRIPSSCSRSGGSATDSEIPSPEGLIVARRRRDRHHTSMRPRLLRLSLSTRLALMFFSITLLAIAALYVFVAPGLKDRLVGSELWSLRATARHRSAPLAATVGGSGSQARVRRLVTETSESTGYRVTLVEVNQVLGSIQLSRQTDSGGADSSAPVVLTLAWRAARTGRVSSGTTVENGTSVAQAAVPVRVGGRVTAIVLYTSSLKSILRTVSTVRDEILEAGAGSLALALVAGWVIARGRGPRGRPRQGVAHTV